MVPEDGEERGVVLLADFPDPVVEEELEDLLRDAELVQVREELLLQQTAELQLQPALVREARGESPRL